MALCRKLSMIKNARDPAALTAICTDIGTIKYAHYDSFLSMMVSHLLLTFGQKTSPSVKLDELFYYGAAVAVNDDRAVLDLHRADSFVVIQAGVDR